MKTNLHILLGGLTLTIAMQAHAMRWYSPSTGRWFSRDPIDERGGKNLYGYVLNNPINAFDVWGLGTWDITIRTADSLGEHGFSARDWIFVKYTMGQDEMKCCRTFRIRRSASPGLFSNSNDDRDAPLSGPGGVGESSPDQPGGIMGVGPQFIPITFHFTWKAICTDGCCRGSLLSETSRDFSLFLYHGQFDPQPSPPTRFYPYPGAGPL